MRPGAMLRVATDIEDYVRQALQEVPRAGFDWLAERPGDWRAPWDDWLPTRYEQKALREGRRPHYLTFRRHAATGMDDTRDPGLEPGDQPRGFPHVEPRHPRSPDRPTLRPSLTGEAVVPGDKSISHRALIFGAMCGR